MSSKEETKSQGKISFRYVPKQQASQSSSSSKQSYQKRYSYQVKASTNNSAYQSRSSTKYQ